MKKKFTVGAVLSVVTGVLVAKGLMGDVHAVCNHIRAGKGASEEIKRQYPVFESPAFKLDVAKLKIYLEAPGISDKQSLSFGWADSMADKYFGDVNATIELETAQIKNRGQNEEGTKRRN